ncbi:MAG TPA: hypothetical protein VK211_02390 [Kamptonema sp.]|nr:hypothetical protein [Kamptonema sp.]
MSLSFYQQQDGNSSELDGEENTKVPTERSYKIPIKAEPLLSADIARD